MAKVGKEIEKPCNKLGYCPYGELVELSKLRAKKTSNLFLQSVWA